MKEHDIITCIREKQENAAERFLLQYRPLIRYVAAPFLSDEQDLEECIHDVALKVCDKIGTFDAAKGSWNAWITAITRNTALNRVRSGKRTHATVSLDTEEMLEIPSADATPEEILLKKERQELMLKAIRELSRQETVLFYRRYYYQQQVRQIAAELGMTERAVEGKLYRIRKKLKDRIGGEFFDESS